MNKIITFAAWLLLIGCQPTQKHPKPNALESNHWQLNVEQSTFSFVTTKNQVIKEQNSIQFKAGRIVDLTLDD